MTLLTFDTLNYATKLKDAGMCPKLADVQAHETATILNEWAVNHLATKQDLKDLQAANKADLHNLEMKMYLFIAKTATFTVVMLGGLQTLFHFI